MMQLSFFTDKGFRISWTLVDIGFLGSQEFKNELSIKEVCKYARTLLMEQKHPDDLLIEFEWESYLDEGIVDEYIKRLVKKENISRELEYRKWRVVYVAKMIELLPKDPLYGLLGLGEIWLKMNNPSDMPHIIQGVGNTIGPVDYYTKKNYDDLLQKHYEWLGNETQEIINIQNQVN